MPTIPLSFTGSLTGDIAALDRFSAKIENAFGRRGLAQLSGALGREGIVQIRDGFREERDPYGNAWAGKVFPDGNKILRKSGGLYDSWYVSQADASGYRIQSSKNYAKFQFGTGIYGPRGQKIRPKTARALRIPGAAVQGVGGKFKSGAMYFRSVNGARARLMLPEGNVRSQIWDRAFVACAKKFYAEKMARSR
jgi:hypothetical protein